MILTNDLGVYGTHTKVKSIIYWIMLTNFLRTIVKDLEKEIIDKFYVEKFGF